VNHAKILTPSLAAIAIAIAACAPMEDAEMESASSGSSMVDRAMAEEPMDSSDAMADDSGMDSMAKDDPREGLKAGLYDAEVASWNIELVQNVRMPEAFIYPPLEEDVVRPNETEEDANPQFATIFFANTDLAFQDDKIFMGNFHGFNIYQNTDGEIAHLTSVVCPGGQGDVSVYGDLLFMSVEANNGRVDCGSGGVEGQSSADRFRGVRIFDISDITNPVQVGQVQTCRGSHTHTLVPFEQDDSVVYIYGNGTAGVRPESELEICSGGDPEDNPDTALFSIDVIEVPLDAPQNAAIVNRPRIFQDEETGEIAGLWGGGDSGEGTQSTAQTNQCHDITAFPHYNLAGGACSGNGLLLDISDPVNPVRIAEAFDENMAYWHSATFDNDATKVLFTDEWGGGLGARCTPEEPDTWGANLVIDITEDGFEKKGFFKIPGNQTKQENCVAHNGNLVPVPGRDIMVQSWYQGGISVVDFTDSENPYEIAFFDRGPVSEYRLYLSGYWGSYWHNGRVYGAEISRGLDVLELQPSEHLSENELAAAKLISFDQANTQTQDYFVWPAEPVVAHAYLDQLEREGAAPDSLIAETRAAVAAWDAGNADADVMNALAATISAAAEEADDDNAVRMRGLADVLTSAG